MPAKKLTLENILAEPNGKKVVVIKDKLSPIQLRVTPTGKALQVMSRWVGAKHPAARKLPFEVNETLDLVAARAMANKWYADHKTVDPNVKPTESVADEHSTSGSMRDTIEAFFAHRRFRKVIRARQEWLCLKRNLVPVDKVTGKVVTKVWHDVDYRQVTQKDCKKLLVELFAVKPQEARYLKRTMLALFTWLADEELIPSNPMAGIKAMKLFRVKDQPRERYFRADEIKPLLRGIWGENQTWRDALLFLLLSGLRLREALHLHEREVDLSEFRAVCRIPGPRMKTKVPHVVALPWQLKVMLKRRLETRMPGGFVFSFGNGKPLDDAAPPKTRVAKRCGFSDWQWHDARRLLSQIYDEGLKLPPHIAEATLAHVQPGVNQSYNKSTYLDDRFEAAQRYADWLEEKCGVSMTGLCDPTNQWIGNKSDAA